MIRISKRLGVPSSKLRGFEKGKVGPVDNKDFIEETVTIEFISNFTKYFWMFG